MSTNMRKADQFKPIILDIVYRSETPLKRFVVHYILWNIGVSGFPPKDGGAFQCAIDELVADGKISTIKTARGTTLSKVIRQVA